MKRTLPSRTAEIILLSSSSEDEEDIIEVLNIDENNENNIQKKFGFKGHSDGHLHLCHPEIDETSASNSRGQRSIKEAAMDNSLLPSPSVIPRKLPEVGYAVFGQLGSALHSWHTGIVNGVRERFGSSEVEYDIKFVVEKIRNDYCGVQKVEHRNIFRQLPAHLLAYDEVTPFKLPVGSRVIATMYNGDRNNFFVGIIAEPNNKSKNNRYLIFFDEGTAQYTNHNDVRLVSASSVKVWQDVYPDSQTFIENYIRKYPEVPLAGLTKDSKLTVEWNGKPWIAKVLEVDNSLVKLEFDFSGHTEWIYRGSQRLLQYQAKKSKVGQSHVLSPDQTKYTITKSGVFGDIEKYHFPYDNPKESWLEYEGKMECLQFPPQTSKERGVFHECAEGCLPGFNTNGNSIPHFAIPFHVGFTRTIKQHSVNYRSPCGKVFATEEQLHEFLFSVNSDLGIDQFSYNPDVRCAIKFWPKSMYYKIRDISFGKNVVPVECVNSLDMEMPAYFEYSNERVPCPEVGISDDTGFLTCCECKDDCQDKNKCACWQMTLSGSAFQNSRKRRVPGGYEFRRLYVRVSSGIYECNKTCPCRKTCLNRVIQNNPRTPIQIFKTAKKGWAIRPLCDIPVGSFICNYGGQILTEAKADEDGKMFGDEYLFDINHIEVGETSKPGYESSADISKDDTDGDQSSDGQSCTITGSKHPIKEKRRKSTRQYFGKDQNRMYIIDAKAIGNIGRYLNHSCDPNVFVQNVFVDSHDIRFPSVSFFASRTIKAGTELTWDYNYKIGSVPGKVLYCHCATPKCKERFL